MKNVCVAMVGMLLVASSAFAGRLEMGSAQVEGDTVRIPINLTGDVADGVASMNFEVRYDPQVLEPVETAPGQAAMQAGKSVSPNVAAPGEYRLVIMGLNQSVMQSGEVATVVMRRVGDATSGQSNVRIVGTTFASLAADEIPSRGDSQNLRLDGSSDPESPDESSDEEEPEESMDDDDPQQADSRDSSNDNERVASNATPSAGNPATSSSNPSSTSQGAMPTTSGGATGGATSGASGAGATPSPSNVGNRLNDAVAQTSGARTNLPTPQASPSSTPSAATSTTPGTQVQSSTSTSPAPAAGQESTMTEVQVADASSESPMPAEASGAMSQPVDSAAAPSTTGDTTAAAPTSAEPAEAAGPNMGLLAIVVGAVALGIGALVLVRKRLFA